MKKFFVIAAALLICFAAGAQNQPKSAVFTPKKGDFSFGVTFNPLTEFASYQPSTGDFAGDYIKGLGEYPHQLYFLGVEPKLSFVLRKHLKDNWSARAAFGISGSRINYKEYVRDDHAWKKTNGESLNTVEDAIVGDLKGWSLGVAAEYNKSFGRLSFIAGFGILFARGGGQMEFSYGNAFSTDDNANNPTTMAYTKMTENSLNEYTAGKVKNIAVARPIERYNIGMCTAIGLTCDMGLEYFFAGQMSITAAVTFSPVTFFSQPQTYAKFEGYNTNDQEVQKFNLLVSPGSKAILYGTQNVGLRFGFHYYL